jgi:hypothetical protein
MRVMSRRAIVLQWKPFLVLYVYYDTLGEAEKMYERTLQGYEKALGPEHTSTINIVNNLGNLYAD